MEQEKTLNLILDKLQNIEIDQKEIKKELLEVKKEQKEMKKDIKEIFKRLDTLEKGQKSIQQYIINAEDAFRKYDESHRFVEKLRKVASE